MKKSRKLVKKSRKPIKKSRKPIKKSRKAIKKSRKAIKKSRKAIKKSRKLVKKSRKAIKKSRKAIKKSRKRRSRKRSRKKQSRSRKNKFKMKTMEPWWKPLLYTLLYQGGLPGDKRGRAPKAEAISPLMATLPPHLIYEILEKNAPGDVLPVGSVLGSDSANMIKLRKRIKNIKAFQRKVRDDQKLQIALPGYPINTRTSRIENLFEFLSQKLHPNLTPEQIHEVRRLVANAYTTRDGGYSDAELFGTGRMANTWQIDDPEDRKAFRRNLLAGAPLTARVIGSERLPLSLEILRKGRRFPNDVIPSDRYPRDADGNIDETHDIFWPKTRNAMNKFLRIMPTNKEILYFGY